MDGANDVPPTAIAERKREHKSGIVCSAFNGVREDTLDTLWQCNELTNRIDTDVISVKLVELGTQVVFEQPHKCAHFCFGTLPIFGAKCVERQVANPKLCRCFDDISDRFYAFPMSCNTRQVPRSCPAPVTIHDDSNMAWKALQR
ncbi:hypothetical protein HRbin20_01311 [bacterium HR20]|nr:hypothetical protein HRbin20_01311 [bacterium HR20]